MQNNRMVFGALGIVVFVLLVGVFVRYEVLKGRTQAGAAAVTDFSSCLSAEGDLDITGTICTSANGSTFKKPGAETPVLTPAPIATSTASTSPVTAPPHSAPSPLLLNVPTTFFLLDAKKITGGPTITMNAINDSRCKPNVQCIWAGEFSTELTIVTGTDTKTITLGTVHVNTLTSGLYTYTLNDANTDQATITVTKATASTTPVR